MGLAFTGVRAAYGNRTVIFDVSFEAGSGELTAIVGPNGSGKTTLLRIAIGSLRPASGEVTFDGRSLISLSPAERARTVAVVRQDNRIDLPLTVTEIVLMGRAPHVGRWRRETTADIGICADSLQRVGASDLGGRIWGELSGGEQQKAAIARALAQQPRLLLLDEPTNHLDISHQHEVMGLARDLAHTDGLTVVAVLHDLNLAAAYADRMIVVSDGRIWMAGEPADVVTRDVIHQVYGVELEVRRHPLSGRPLVFTGARVRETVADGPGVHVVGGGGAAADILDALCWAGVRITFGPVNIGDHDWVRAREVGAETIDLPPFSPVTEDARQRALTAMRSSAGVIVAPAPFGPGNIASLTAVVEAQTAGIPVAIAGGTDPGRDWTGGQMSGLLDRLLDRGAVAIDDDMRSLSAWLDELKGSSRSRRTTH